MNRESFWETAWSTANRLVTATPESSGSAALVQALHDDLTLQSYVFDVRGFSDPRWLHAFRQEGLFDEPPELQTTDGGVRARAWPALTYLRAVANAEPRICAAILERVASDNWWVVSDALSVAAELPVTVAKSPVLSLLREWERSAVQWTQPETLVQSMRAIASSDPEGAALTEAMVRILGRFADDRSNHYELGELLPQIRTEIGDVAVSPLADAVEDVLIFGAAVTGRHPFTSSLEDLRVDADGVDLLVHEWLDSVTREAKSGGFRPLRRCIRLATSDTALLRQMGLRALSISLSAEPSEHRSLQVLAKLGERDDLTVDYEELPELLRLFGAHLPKLGNEAQAALIQRLSEQATGEDRIERIFARDWLAALRPHLGARERQLLVELEAEEGPPRETFALPRVEAVWVGPRSTLTLDELQHMPVADLLGYISHVPVRPDSSWPLVGATAEGFARLLQPLLTSRIDELWPHLPDMARSATDSVVLFYLLWGVRDAFGETSAKDAARLASVQEFIGVAMEWTNADQPPESTISRNDHSVARAIADLLEHTGDWLVEAPNTDALLTTFEWLLTSNDPPNSDADNDQMDPPSRAINSVRGEAVLAALRILSLHWGEGGRPETALATGIKALLHANLATEESPAVLSSYGRYLPSIIAYWRPFFDAHQDRLLPSDDASIDRWGAVVGSYVTFYGPHRLTAQVLRPHLQLAVQRLPALAGTYLGKQAERLLMHLIALALPRADDSGDWAKLLHAAMDSIESTLAARAVHDLAFAVERDGLDIPTGWTLSFVGRRADSLTSRETHQRVVAQKNDEPSALVALLFANGLQPPVCIGHVRHLVELGARLNLDAVVDYLTKHDDDRSHSGAVILQIAAEQEFVGGYMRHLDQAKDLIRTYAQTYVDLGWAIVDALGRHGIFAFEDVASEVDRMRTSGNR